MIEPRTPGPTSAAAGPVGGRSDVRGGRDGRGDGDVPRPTHRWRDRRSVRPGLVFAAAVLGLMICVWLARPGSAQAQAQFNVWRSPQFSLSLAYPLTWSVTEERSDPLRGDVLILGNETSALLVALLHDTRTPRQMSDDLILGQKEQTPDLAVLHSEVTPAGSILLFMQYTIRPGSEAAMLIDEKALVGPLVPGSSTITVRGMVPDHADVAAEFEQLEEIIGTLGPDG